MALNQKKTLATGPNPSYAIYQSSTTIFWLICGHRVIREMPLGMLSDVWLKMKTGQEICDIASSARYQTKKKGGMEMCDLVHEMTRGILIWW